MALESNIYALWASKQVAKGTPNTAGTKRLIQVAGDLEVQRADSSEAFSDLDRYGNQTDFVNTLMGAGSPGVEGQSDVLAYLSWIFFGGETFTAGTNPIHTITKGTATGGQFDITVGTGAALATLAGNAITITAAALQTALNALPNIAAAGGVVCAGGPLNTTPITVTFNNPSPIATTAFVINSNATTPLTGGTAPTDAITTPGAMATHLFTPQPNGGFWSTFMSRVGASVIKRQQFSDVLISNLTIEGSTSAKVLRVTPNAMVVTPGLTYSSDPTTVINLANVPFLYTDGAGTFTIDGNVFQGQTQFNITWEQAFNPAYGDSVTPFDMVPGLARVTIAVSVVVDAAGLQQYNRIIYGNPSPSPGTQPLKTIPAMGSWSANLTRATGEAFACTIPAVHWAPGLSIPPNPQGGVTDISLAGEMRKVLGQPATTVTIKNPDNAAYTT